MDIETYLKSYRVLKRELERLQRETMREAKILLDCGNPSQFTHLAQNFQGTPSTRQPIKGVAECIDAVLDRAHTLAAKTQLVTDKLTEIDTAIINAGLSDCEWRYVLLRYIDGHEHQKIAIIMSYSRRGVDDIRARALQKIERTCPNVHKPC
jgi:DNA-directed RNA polymerase specialized sigma24 family protein